MDSFWKRQKKRINFLSPREKHNSDNRLITNSVKCTVKLWSRKKKITLTVSDVKEVNGLHNFV